MNIKVFKKLIKEAVVDAIHEELPYILEEHMAKQEKKVFPVEDSPAIAVILFPDTPPNTLPETSALKMYEPVST